MCKNVGAVDRVIRVILGLVILAVGWHFQSWLGLIGIVPLATALIGWCPLYCPLKLSTCCKGGPSKTDAGDG
jgi:Inner membrane protein YgaP-like, transmembrane domain